MIGDVNEKGEVGMHLITCISGHNWTPSSKFLLHTDKVSSPCALDTGGSLARGVGVQEHVELVYKSEVFCANNLSIVTEEDTIDCCQSAIVVNGEDPLLAATAICSGALYQPIGQSVNGARYGCSKSLISLRQKLSLIRFGPLARTLGPRCYMEVEFVRSLFCCEWLSSVTPGILFPRVFRAVFSLGYSGQFFPSGISGSFFLAYPACLFPQVPQFSLLTIAKNQHFTIWVELICTLPNRY